MKLVYILSIISVIFSTPKSKTVIDLSKKENNLNYSSIANSVCYIDLKINSENLFGDINQLCKDDSLVFLLDKKQKMVFIFDTSGNFLSKLDMIGRGPGEYISITSITLDKGRNILCLLDDMQQKILKYDYKGNFINEIKYDQSTIIRSFAFLNNNYVLFTPEYLSRTRDGVWVVDTLGNFKQELKDVDSKYKFSSSPFPYYSSYKSNSLSFYDCNTEEIYTLSDKMICEYKFDFKQKMPLEYHATDEAVFTQDGKLRGTGNYYRISKINECDNYYCLKYNSNFKGDVFVFINKKNGKIRMGNSLVNDFDKTNISMQELFSYEGNSFAMLVWSDDLKPLIQIINMK